MHFEADHSSTSSSSTSSCSHISKTKPNNTSPPSMQPKRKAGRNKFKHPIYKGVRLRNGSKWVCEVREPNKKSRIWLGTFPTPEMAARAHDVAALALRGEAATLNFPDSAWLLKRAKSCSGRDIQKAALEAAMTFCQGHNMSPFSVVRPSSIDLHTIQLQEVSSANSIRLDKEKKCVEGSESEKVLDNLRMMFVDEEALFNMPGLIDSMAEGLVITPPAMKPGFDWDDEMVNCDIDLSLWKD